VIDNSKKLQQALFTRPIEVPKESLVQIADGMSYLYIPWLELLKGH
jgi:hypothetical protein